MVGKFALLMAVVLIVSALAGSTPANDESSYVLSDDKDWSQPVPNIGTNIGNMTLIQTTTLSGNGEVTLSPGYIYLVTVAGSSGAAGASSSNGAATGGSGALIGAWINLAENESYEEFSYRVGVGGSTTGGGAGAGGAGSSFFYGDIPIIVAGGGGGGGSRSVNDNQRGGNGGNAGFGASVPYGGGIVYAGSPGETRSTPQTSGSGGGAGSITTGAGGSAGGNGGAGAGGGTGTSTNGFIGTGGSGNSVAATTGGGGGGGGGYRGGGGGGSGDIGHAAGGGGGGGSSFISDMVIPASATSRTGSGFIQIQQYAIVEDAKILSDDAEEFYTGAPQTKIEEITKILGLDTGMELTSGQKDDPESANYYLQFNYFEDEDKTILLSGPPTDAGTYYVEISFSGHVRYPSTDTVTVELTIKPIPLTKPSAIDNRAPYNEGLPVTLLLRNFINNMNIMTVSGHIESAMSIPGPPDDPYIAVVVLEDKHNYRWINSSDPDDTDDVLIPWWIVESLSITGKVTFFSPDNPSHPADWTPLEGVEVFYSTRNNADPDPHWIDWPSVRTDENGMYTILFVLGDDIRLDNGESLGYVPNPGQLPRELLGLTEKVTSPGNGDFTMYYDPSKTFTISGKVTGPTGDSIPDVQIEYTYTFGGVTYDPYVNTKEDGTYVITLPAGAAFFEITRVFMAGFEEPDQEDLLEIELILDDYIFDIELEYTKEMYTVGFYVYDEEGKPIQGAVLHYNLRYDSGDGTPEDELGIPTKLKEGKSGLISYPTNIDGVTWIEAPSEWGVIEGIDDYWLWIEIIGVTYTVTSTSEKGYVLVTLLPDWPDGFEWTSTADPWNVLPGDEDHLNFLPPRFFKMDDYTDEKILGEYEMRSVPVVEFRPSNGQSPWRVMVDPVTGLVEEPSASDPRLRNDGYEKPPLWFVLGSDPEHDDPWDFDNDEAEGLTILVAVWERIPGMLTITVNAKYTTWEFVEPENYAAVFENDELIITFKSDLGYELPSRSGITVTMGGETFNLHDWYRSTLTDAIFTIDKDLIDDDIVITFEAEPSGIFVHFAVMGGGGTLTAMVGDKRIETGTQVNMGTVIVFTGNPYDTTWQVSGWYLNGSSNGETGSSFTHTVATVNNNIGVTFERVMRNVEFNYGEGGGSISGSIFGGSSISSPTTVLTGQTIQLNASPLAGYRILAWYAEDSSGVKTQVASRTPVLIYTVTDDVKITVEFDFDPAYVFTLEVLVTNRDGGAPLSNVLIEYTITNPETGGAMVRDARTGSNGIYGLMVPPGMILEITRISMAGFQEPPPGELFGPEPIDADRSWTISLDYAADTRKMEFYVFDIDTGDPIPGVVLNYNLRYDSGGSDDVDYDGIPFLTYMSGTTEPTDTEGLTYVLVRAEWGGDFWSWIEITGVTYAVTPIPDYTHVLVTPLPDWPSDSSLWPSDGWPPGFDPEGLPAPDDIWAYYGSFGAPRFFKMDFDPDFPPLAWPFPMKLAPAVEFDPNNNGQSPTWRVPTDGSGRVPVQSDPRWDGYDFLGWFLPGSDPYVDDPWDFVNGTTDVFMILVAEWERIPGMLTVTVDAKHTTWEFKVPPDYAAVFGGDPLTVEFKANLGYILPSTAGFGVSIMMDGDPFTDYTWQVFPASDPADTFARLIIDPGYIYDDLVIKVEVEESDIYISFGIIGGTAGDLYVVIRGETYHYPYHADGLYNEIRVNEGEILSFTAVPDPGYRIKTWWVGDDRTGVTSSPFLFTVGDESEEIYVEFDQTLISPTSHDFGVAAEGYANAPLEKVFTITNNSTVVTITNLAVLDTFLGTAFEIVGTVPDTILPRDFITITVRPVTGLLADVYEGKLVIEGDNYLRFDIELRFEVTDYTATVNANLDGSTWTPSPPTFTLVKDDDESETHIDNGSKVVPGTYKIYADGEDTGETITIVDSSDSKTLNYFTLTLTGGNGIDDVYMGAVVSTTGAFLENSSVSISALVGTGYAWLYWTDDDDGDSVHSTTNMITVTITDTLNLTANANPVATVTVTLDGAPRHSLAVTLTSDNGVTFITMPETTVGTSGIYAAGVPGDAGGVIYKIYIGGADTGRTITIYEVANSATLNYFTLTLVPGIGVASVTGAGIQLAGSTVSIDATLNTGFAWVGWAYTATAAPFDDDQNASFTMPSNTLGLTATANPVATVTVTLDGAPRHSLTVELSSDNGMTFITLPETTVGTSGIYAAGVPNGMYTIYVNGENTGRTIAMSNAANSATLNYFTLTLTAGTGITSVTGDGPRLAGSTVSINAAVDTGLVWVNWTNDSGGAEYAAAQNASFTMPSSILGLTANANPIAT
ncbi:MAG: hypothetical protein FWD81_02040, partial [Methanomassiliicoccaceae archaeon]|nr:hypothetical protein [Methanomassiliicoccaceae archaeon]